MSKVLKCLTSEEVEKMQKGLASIFSSTRELPKVMRNITMINMFMSTGIRLSELAGLAIGDLIYNGRPVFSLIIRSAIAKNHRERTVPLTPQLQADIQGLYNVIWWPRLLHPDEPAFLNLPKYNRLSTRQIQRIVKSFTLLIINRAVSPHVLRHTFATRIMRTASIRVVQALLGHSKLSSTQIYTHPNHEDLAKAIGGLDSAPV